MDEVKGLKRRSRRGYLDLFAKCLIDVRCNVSLTFWFEQCETGHNYISFPSYPAPPQNSLLDIFVNRDTRKLR